jgi:hemerythrin HHE cation binding domain-containing protein
MPRPTAVRPRSSSSRSRPRRLRQSSIAGTGGGHRNTGRGGPGGEARPSPGTSPPGTPDLRGGAEATVTTGPVSDALDRLQSQHREIAALLARGFRALEPLAEALGRHAEEEEEILYPALREAAERRFAPVLIEAVRQHRGIDRLVEILRGLPPGPNRRQRFEELRARVEEHVREVEATLFPEALRRLTRPERLALGERMDLLGRSVSLPGRRA